MKQFKRSHEDSLGVASFLTFKVEPDGVILDPETKAKGRGQVCWSKAYPETKPKRSEGKA
jgi:hypothetical protein